MWMGCAVGVLVRLLLFLAGASTYLEEHIEFTSPMTSHTQLKEGLFLLRGGSSPYAGGTCHTPPLLLLLLGAVGDCGVWAHFLLVTLLDVVVARLLQLIAADYKKARGVAGKSWAEASMNPSALSAANAGSEEARSAAGALQDVVSPTFVGLSYLLNPFSIAGCLALSLQNVHHVLACSAVYFAGRGSAGSTIAFLALALYVVPISPILLILPCAYLCFKSKAGEMDVQQPDKLRYVQSRDEIVVNLDFCKFAFGFGFAVIFMLMGLLVASFYLMDSSMEFLDATHVAWLTLQDLTPNVGIFWYVFIEVFDRYRTLFLIVFHCHIFFYPLPLHLRVGRHAPIGPWLQCAAAVGIMTIFKAYPTASDYGLMLSMLLIHFELIQECQKTFVFLMSGLLFGLAMFPTMTAVWLTRNAGNANFLYNMTLVVNIFGSLLLSEWLKAGIRLRRRMRMTAVCEQFLMDALDKKLAETATKED
mmetsp:Transcript_59155/g.132585  ORF Transcript_59155/g.132585 Transcript_59155/m.132585 type:complete len:475 (-) Transcript_59155:8-1432(-)